MYLKAIDDATNTLKKATGFPRFKSLEKVLPPNEAKLARDVARDLERAYSARHPIQPTKLGGMGNLSKEVVELIPSVLSRPVVIADTVLSHIGKSAVQPELERLAGNAVLSPSFMEELLARQHPSLTPQTIRMLAGLKNAGQIGVPALAGQYIGNQP